jgi:serine/threonine protein kinase
MERYRLDPADIIIHDKSLDSKYYCSIYKGRYNENTVSIRIAENQDYESDIGRKLKQKDIIFLCRLESLGRSKHIPKFYGFCYIESKIYLVFEDIINKEVRKYLNPNQEINFEFNFEQKIKIILEAAKALEYIHRNGIIHFQFKSANLALNKILTDPNDLDFTVLINDFEIFRGDDRQYCHVPGKCKYYSPEQQNEFFTNKSDIYQFAYFIYEIFSGVEIYTDRKTKNLNDTNILRYTKLRNLRPDSNMVIGDDCPPEIIELYMRNWELEKDKRMNTKELVEFLTGYYEKLFKEE